ncbi:phospho-N-acetylmuramoyl-pentapeptide-transferase [Lachnospiraceae bacterium XPB1003]|nr:phospho-N-acetylmuramoyl-pentapeptide-transferase [Lachnospiraceae bacterium XPB1003]
MLYSLMPEKVLMPLAVLVSFFLTFISIILFKNKLPQDMGRAFAVNGAQSKGKARGAGIILIFCFVAATLLFIPLSIETGCYLSLLVAVMFTGFFDDASKKPWGNLVKGILDSGIAVLTAVTYLYFNDNKIDLILFDISVEIPLWLYAILIILLVFASINVINCTDGVDGLCGSLSILTLGAFACIPSVAGLLSKPYEKGAVLFIAVLLAYLCFNTKPSTILMGDAGSRSIGLLVAIIALKSHSPLLFIPFTFVMIIDGGLGLLKLTVLRIEKGVFKKKNPVFMKSIRTPIHDHVRKNLAEDSRWSDPQVVWRFLIIQAMISISVLLFLSFT